MTFEEFKLTRFVRSLVCLPEFEQVDDVGAELLEVVYSGYIAAKAKNDGIIARGDLKAKKVFVAHPDTVDEIINIFGWHEVEKLLGMKIDYFCSWYTFLEEGSYKYPVLSGDNGDWHLEELYA